MNFQRETGDWQGSGPWIPGRGLILEVWEGMNMCQIESVNTE